MSCPPNLCELCLPVLTINWFVDGRASDVGVLLIQQGTFYRSLNEWRKMNEQIHFVAAIITIIIKHLVSFSPHVLSWLISFCCIVFPPNNSPPELPAIGSKVRTTQKMVQTKVRLFGLNCSLEKVSHLYFIL